jgi:protein gp37
MGKDTGISWTDSTFNPWHGCVPVSPGCDNCYAAEQDIRYGGESHWGKGAPRRTFGDKHWKQPLQWDRDAKAAGVIHKVFCGSMCDVMDDEAPAGQREQLWELIDATPNLIWQLLTKRTHRYTRYLPESGFKHDNVWLGTTCESQQFYDTRWPILYDICDLMGLVSFISYEPAIGPLTMLDCEAVPDWLIFGGETGDNRRPMQEQWARDIKAECEEFGVAFFMKQMSAYSPAQAAKLIPVDLLVRQSPKAA